MIESWLFPFLLPCCSFANINILSGDFLKRQRAKKKKKKGFEITGLGITFFPNTWFNVENLWRHVGKEAYDATGQSQLGQNFAGSLSNSPSHSHSAELLQTQGGVYDGGGNRTCLHLNLH